MQDKFGTGMNWYRSQIWNLSQRDEAEAKLDAKLPHPVLMLAATKDLIATPKFAESIKGFAANLTFKQVDAGHWPQLEKSEEVNGILENFIIDSEKTS
jgi:soluble epoxide hydrolase/lipid-phosphate phosphatase